jgi:hypothetical protein
MFMIGKAKKCLNDKINAQSHYPEKSHVVYTSFPTFHFMIALTHAATNSL